MHVCIPAGSSARAQGELLLCQQHHRRATALTPVLRERICPVARGLSLTLTSSPLAWIVEVQGSPTSAPCNMVPVNR